MSREIGDFTNSSLKWDVYDIYDTCTDMPHASAPPPHRHWLGSTDIRQAVEYEATWACGGLAATTTYLNLKSVREALHVEDWWKKWAMQVDLAYHCSNDDEAAQRPPAEHTKTPPSL